MKSKFIKDITAAILQEKENILSKQPMISDIDISGDEVDEIQGKILANITAQLSSRDTLKLKQIEAALEKIKEGTFGACEECGEDISEKRILINPMFINCIGCAEHLEAQERRRRF